MNLSMKMMSPKIFEISPEMFLTHYRKQPFIHQTIKKVPVLPTLLPEGSSQILKHLWTIGGWLLIVPTADAQNSEMSSLWLQWFRYFHKIACGVISVLTVALMTVTVLSMCRRNLDQLSSDPSGLFICFELISFLYLVIVVYATGWRLGRKLEALFQRDCQHIETNANLKNWRKLLISPQSGWILMSLLYILNRMAEFADSAFTTHGYYTKFSRRFYQAFFFLGNEANHPYLTILCAVAYASPRIVRIYGAITAFAGITLHGSAVREFTKRIEQSGSLAEFRAQFATLQRQVDELNKLMGRIVLGFSLYIFPMIMVWSTDLFYDSNKEGKARDKATFFIDFVAYTTFYGMAANNYQSVVSTVEETVLQNREMWKLDAGEFAEFLYRARHSELGVSGGGFFTITYKCIASVLSFILTYTIVLIQLKSIKSETAT